MRNFYQRFLLFLATIFLAVSFLCGCSAQGGVPTREEGVKQKPVVPEGGILL